MSMTLYMPNDLRITCRQAWGQIFGCCIEKTREAGGRSIEQAAHLAGMEASQWAAIEAGYVPTEAAQLRSMAGALECGYDKISTMALLCQDAWEQ